MRNFKKGFVEEGSSRVSAGRTVKSMVERKNRSLSILSHLNTILNLPHFFEGFGKVFIFFRVLLTNDFFSATRPNNPASCALFPIVLTFSEVYSSDSISTLTLSADERRLDLILCTINRSIATVVFLLRLRPNKYRCIWSSCKPLPILEDPWASNATLYVKLPGGIFYFGGSSKPSVARNLCEKKNSAFHCL